MLSPLSQDQIPFDPHHQGLEEYRHHLEGHPYKIEIWLDHQNLTFFRTAQKLTRRQARWTLFMTHFDFVLYHKPGKTMQVEDPLSRQADHEMGIDLDNMNQVLLNLSSSLSMH